MTARSIHPPYTRVCIYIHIYIYFPFITSIRTLLCIQRTSQSTVVLPSRHYYRPPLVDLRVLLIELSRARAIARRLARFESSRRTAFAVSFADQQRCPAATRTMKSGGTRQKQSRQFVLFGHHLLSVPYRYIREDYATAVSSATYLDTQRAVTFIPFGAAEMYRLYAGWLGTRAENSERMLERCVIVKGKCIDGSCSKCLRGLSYLWYPKLIRKFQIFLRAFILLKINEKCI